MKRYFFDSSSQRCVHFFYGGCFGNANNFRSMSECRARCQSTGRPGRKVLLFRCSAPGSRTAKGTDEHSCCVRNRCKTPLGAVTSPGEFDLGEFTLGLNSS
ncbi:Kunitz-type serine protease inhibitor kunitoxin-Phi1 [Liparis tanakae]|uniref:Kunitz-type serine protease inhibitor kunitoxin-Phi1 n=1 Tax=Liparis tanakae TaxID=230148 RepID=A0A4Z2DYH5_9TELE|nr:Kunitz-type serine protease inhibitor kunitoxin-Phi1 [Liparis tanakae]